VRIVLRNWVEEGEGEARERREAGSRKNESQWGRCWERTWRGKMRYSFRKEDLLYARVPDVNLFSRPTHVKWRNHSRDLSNIYKRTQRLIMISNTSSASLQSKGSAQSSIPYTRYCYSPPPRTEPMPSQPKITQSSVILNCSNGIGLKLLMSMDRNLNPSSQCGGTSL
jgi:hypothetical protein